MGWIKKFWEKLRRPIIVNVVINQPYPNIRQEPIYQGCDIDELNKAYEGLTPDILFGKMELEEFANWVSKGTKDDLKCALKEFEKAEMYHHCEVIYRWMDLKGWL